MLEEKRFKIGDYIWYIDEIVKIENIMSSSSSETVYCVVSFIDSKKYFCTGNVLKSITIKTLFDFVKDKKVDVNIEYQSENQVRELINKFKILGVEVVEGFLSINKNICLYYSDKVNLMLHCAPVNRIVISIDNIDTPTVNGYLVEPINFSNLCTTTTAEIKTLVDMVDDRALVYESDFDKVNFYERLNNEVDDRLTLTNNEQVPPVVCELRDLPPKVSIGDGIYLPRVWEDIRNLVKEEKEDMKLDNEKVNRILVNEKEGIVTVVGEKTKYVIVYGMQKEKVVTMSKISKGDKFDKYIGSAFALGYWHFGSKTKFNKHLQEFYGCAPQEMEQYALIDMYNRYDGRAKFEKYVDDIAKYVIKEEKKPTPKKKPKSKKDKE